VQPAANNKPKANAPAKQGKSYRDDYEREMNAAFASWDAYGSSKSDKDYIDVAVHIYAALKFRNLHAKENGDASIQNFPKSRELSQLKIDWGKTAGPQEDPRVKAAIADWKTTE
jgi:hypothetical protein